MSVLDLVHTDFNLLLSCHRGSTESFRDYERRLESLISKFTLHGDDISFPEPSLALSLLSISGLKESERLHLLPLASAPIQVDKSLAGDVSATKLYTSRSSETRRLRPYCSDSAQESLRDFRLFASASVKDHNIWLPVHLEHRPLRQRIHTDTLLHIQQLYG